MARRSRWGATDRGLPFLVASCAFFLAPDAAADLTMRWDCYLPSTNIDCATLEASLLSKIPFLRSVSVPEDAEVSVTLTSLPAEDATRFKIQLDGKRVEGFATEVHTSDKIPNSIDATTTMVRIMTKLERGLGEFMDLKVAAEVKNGTLTLQLRDPIRLPFEGRREQESLKWFLAPSLGTYFSDVTGVGVNGWGAASVGFNYSELGWRAQQSAGANYSQQSQPVAGTNETASIRFASANVNNVFSWSLSQDDHWNAGLLFAAEKSPQANFRMRENAAAGIELDLVPRQTVNQKNLGARCAFGSEMQHYDAKNIEGLSAQIVGTQFCDIYVSWHFVPVDVWANVGETIVLKSIDYRSVAVSLSATWRLTDNLSFAPWVNVQGINKAINQAAPTRMVSTDPRQEVEASMLAAIQQGYTAPFGVQSGFALKYILGNGSLASEDQRWKNASSLR